MRALRFACLSVLALALSGLGIAHAGPISGQLVLDGKPVPVSEAAAFRMRDQFNPRTLETYVMLTAKPVDRAILMRWPSTIPPCMTPTTSPSACAPTARSP
jgi:hypothetical protein